MINYPFEYHHDAIHSRSVALFGDYSIMRISSIIGVNSIIVVLWHQATVIAAEEELLHVRDEVRSLAIYLEQKKVITGNDKTLITGLTENNNPKLAPEYQPESPYAYPLFKIHKLSEAEIQQKKVPPSRLVHASKFGPLYRMEKWASPYLTTISLSI